MTWANKFLREAGVPKDVLNADHDSDFDTIRNGRIQLLNHVMMGGVYSDHHYDAILVDEIQDFWAAELEILRRLTPSLFVAGDARQRIYARNEGIDCAKRLGCQLQPLTKHYRNGRAICEVADRILPGQPGEMMIDNCQYKEKDDPSRAELYDALDLEGQFAKMEGFLREQLYMLAPARYGVTSSMPRQLLANGPTLN